MVARVLFHLLPLIGVVLWRPNLIIALLLFIALPYIKTKKLKSILGDMNIDPKNPKTDEQDPHSKRTLSAYNFWKRLTFIK